MSDNARIVIEGLECASAHGAYELHHKYCRLRILMSEEDPESELRELLVKKMDRVAGDIMAILTRSESMWRVEDV